MNCPSCGGRLCPSRGDAYRCTRCSYEIGADAWRLHQGLLAGLDADQDAFFVRVRLRTARLRALEPAWH
ncbi:MULTISPECIES: hypothetical protein [unclassified Streptomyces]|uniref:hypothetical protein n=1 Tax=unclassified Streptomyces TaxID=2593676 RepID=UPI001160E88C|nr:hypothetical protein [Streptomyces sp. CB01580]